MAKAKTTRARKTQPNQPRVSFFNGPVFSGKTVTDATATTIPAVYCAIRIIAESVANLPLVLYKKTPEGREKATYHPIYRLLIEPNPECTSSVLRESAMYQLLCRGNYYLEIERNGAGQPVNLWLIQECTPARVEGKLLYQAGSTNLTPQDVCHVKILSPDSIVGLSPITLARNALGNMLSRQEYGGYFYANSAAPNGVISSQFELSDKARENIKKSIIAPQTGGANSGKTIILEEGMTFSPISFSPRDQQFLELVQWDNTLIAQVFNVSPVMLQDLGRATWNNLPALQLAHLTYSIRPYLQKIEEELERKLLTFEERQAGYYIEHNVDALLRTDPSTRMDIAVKGINNGIYSPGDVRELLNMPRYEGDEEFFISTNLQKVTDVGKQLEQQQQAQELQAQAQAQAQQQQQKEEVDNEPGNQDANQSNQ